MESRPNKRLRRNMEIQNETYGEELFSDANVQATRELVAKLLNQIRETKKIKDEEDILWVSKDNHLLCNYRSQCSTKDIYKYRDVSFFKLSLRNLGFTAHENSEKILWLLCQSDGFSCAGASILTCTAGYMKIPPERVALVHEYLNKNNPWEIKGEEIMGDLPIEGMGRLIFDCMGIIPTVICGRVAQETAPGVWEKLDEDDNLFNDEKRFVCLMRIVKFASICCNYPAHWYSLIHLQIQNEDVFVVCDSLSHTSAAAFPSYSSLRRYFFLEKTKPTPHNRDLNKYPLTMSMYPVLQEQKDCDPKVANFMKNLIVKTAEVMEKEEVPFLGWKVLISLLDSLEQQ